MAEKLTVEAFQSGINLFESGEEYANGEAVTEQGLSRKHITEGLRQSLKRLQLDYVDILIVTKVADLPVPVEEVVRSCSHLIQIGWTFYWGTSKWNVSEIMAQSAARQFHLIPAAVDQAELNLFQRNRMHNTQEVCSKLNIGLFAAAPLAGGILSGKYINGAPMYSRATLSKTFINKIFSLRGQTQHKQVHRLCNLASRISCTSAQLAIAWCLRVPHVSSVIFGAATVDQLRENLEAIQVASRLTGGILSEIENILTQENGETFL